MGTHMIEKPVALTIASSDSSGGAGIQADLKAFSSVGVHGSCVIVAITAQNISQGVLAIHELPLDIISKQIDAVINEFKIGAIKTGMLYSPEIVEMISNRLRSYRSNNYIPLIVDPVMVATTGKDLAKGKEYVTALKTHLIPQATVLMPNLHETSTLLGRDVVTFNDMRVACQDLANELGSDNILLKGGHTYIDKQTKILTDHAIDILYQNDPDMTENDRLKEFSAQRYPNDVHGSGCTFSSLITGLLAKNEPLETAITEAKNWITEFIGTGYLLTVPLENDHSKDLDEQNKDTMAHDQVLRELNKGILKLKQLMTHKVITILMPEVGINFGYALPSAVTKQDICGLEGRLVKLGESRVVTPGTLTFGASNHVAAIILAAMNYDKNVRSVLNIKYREKVIDAVENAGLTIGTFDRAEEPEQVSTMEWGTETAIKYIGNVPDIIYDKGGIGKEPMIRIFGRDPNEVIDKLKKIIEKL
jgi:hydroxymethylpyrimidine/phosphomethylpyrimidine kinase